MARAERAQARISASRPFAYSPSDGGHPDRRSLRALDGEHSPPQSRRAVSAAISDPKPARALAALIWSCERLR
jgi:hypothetical protein